MINIEMNTMGYKALNGLAPEYVSELFKRNCVSHLWVLHDSSADLQLPKKTSKMGKNVFALEVRWHGMSFQLKLCRHLLYKS